MAIRIDMLGWNSAPDRAGRGGNRCTYRVYGWFHLVGNDELNSWRLERILWIEPDHEMKDFILKNNCRCRGGRGQRHLMG
jgi:hypothetical protein